MPVQLQLQFARRAREADNIESFYFEAQPSLRFDAGQYLLCTLPHAEVDERGIERAFTIASSPSEPFVRLTTRLSDKPSSFKYALMGLAPGAIIEADGPYGDFVMRDDARPAVFIAGGIGITPFRSILGELFARGDRRPITLLYSSSTPRIAFRPFFDDLASQWPELRVVYTVTRPSSGWLGQTGRIDARLIREHVAEPRDATFYVCGPTPLVDAIRSTLPEIGVDTRHLVSEGFPGYEVPEPELSATATSR